MATYAIGDVQGCYDELRQLLNLIKFKPQVDVLWFCGDLVNRGPKSLEVLRYVRDLPNKVVILGNHDLHLLSIEAHPRFIHFEDTLQKLVEAPDCAELCAWLRQQPLLHYDEALNYVMVHAGLPPQWDLQQAKICAREIEHVLQGQNYAAFLQHMYGNEPKQWSVQLAGWDRLRFIVNCLTRLRFCDDEGNIHLEYKGPLGSQPANLFPWYEISWRLSHNLKILFGHWAALEGKIHTSSVIALDSGCVWGGHLSAFCLEDHKLYQVSCATYAKY